MNRIAALRPWAVAAALALVASLSVSCGQDQREPTAPDAGSPALSARGQAPDLSQAIAAKERHLTTLLQTDGVVGAGVGLTADGRPAVKIFTRQAGLAGLPTTLDGTPVVIEATGEIRALALTAAAPTKSFNTKARTRPAYLGISTGNSGACLAGTIGARVKAGNTVYALSNNHVYALENTADLGSSVSQPGLYDTRCRFSASNVIGTLSNFVQIKFDGSSNVVDAAIAQVTNNSTSILSNSTPPDGYGVPNSTALAGSPLDLTVQKYGRTTHLTTGAVVAVEVTINVGYSSGTARFDHQIEILAAKGQFSRAGDSGSLIVTSDSHANPVGLLFAGSSNGFTFANPIGDVLSSLNVAIDGTSR